MHAVAHALHLSASPALALLLLQEALADLKCKVYIVARCRPAQVLAMLTACRLPSETPSTTARVNTSEGNVF
jgi:hypothetical protein